MRTNNSHQKQIRHNSIKLLHIALSTAQNSFKVTRPDLNSLNILHPIKLQSEIAIAALKPIQILLGLSSCDSAVETDLGEIEFLKPAFYGDFIKIRSKIYKVEGAVIHVFVHAAKQDSRGNVQTISVAKLVFVTLKNGQQYAHNVQLNYN